MSMRSWFEALSQVCTREVRELAARPREIIICGLVPMLWMTVIWFMLSVGVITDVPIGFVDNDHTEMSREIGRALEAERTSRLIPFADYQSADKAMRKGSVYGFIEIPFGYAKDTLKGNGSPVILYLDETRYAIAGTVQASVTSAVQAVTQNRTKTNVLKTGGGVTEAERIIKTVHSDFYALGNMQTSFFAFLGSNLMPGVVMLAAALSFVTAIIRENYLYRIHDWWAAAGGSLSAALLGKFLPHFAFFCLTVAFYIAMFAGFGGFPPAGSLLVWFLFGALTLCVMGSMAVLIAGIAPTWRFALVVTSGYAAPSLPFTGFSMPLDSMSETARLFAKCLPLTWFVEGQSQMWTLGASPEDLGRTLAAFALLIALPLALGIPVFRWRYRKFYQTELKLREEHAI